MCERTGRLADCGHSRCDVVVTKGGGRRRKAVFGYKLCLYLYLCLVMSSG
jgi:hypothetical protein